MSVDGETAEYDVETVAELRTVSRRRLTDRVGRRGSGAKLITIRRKFIFTNTKGPLLLSVYMTASDAAGRRRDILLMTIAIQLTVLGTATENASLVPLAFLGVFITVLVSIEEIGRRWIANAR